jgi:hypothetical protein
VGHSFVGRLLNWGGGGLQTYIYISVGIGVVTVMIFTIFFVYFEQIMREWSEG